MHLRKTCLRTIDRDITKYTCNIPSVILMLLFSYSSNNGFDNITSSLLLEHNYSKKIIKDIKDLIISKKYIPTVSLYTNSELNFKCIPYNDDRSLGTIDIPYSAQFSCLREINTVMAICELTKENPEYAENLKIKVDIYPKCDSDLLLNYFNDNYDKILFNDMKSVIEKNSWIEPYIEFNKVTISANSRRCFSLNGLLKISHLYGVNELNYLFKLLANNKDSKLLYSNEKLSLTLLKEFRYNYILSTNTGLNLISDIANTIYIKNNKKISKDIIYDKLAQYDWSKDNKIVIKYLLDNHNSISFTKNNYQKCLESIIKSIHI